MSEYRVLITNFKTGEIATEAPAISLSATATLNQAETISVSVPLVYAPAINTSLTVSTDGLESVENYTPAKNAVFIARDGVILYGGVIWGTVVDIGAETVTISATGMLSYLRRRRIRNDQSFNTDQDSIARTLVGLADGVAIDTVANTHSVTRSLYLYGFDRLSVERALVDLATLENGFDFYFTHARSGDTVTSTFRTSYPPTGRDTELVVESDQCTTFTVANDGTSMANYAEAKAPLTGERPVFQTALNAAQTATFPQLDDVVTVDQYINDALLLSAAERRLSRGARPVSRISLTKPPDTTIPPNTYLMGDRIRARALVGGLQLDGKYRITADSLAVTDDGQETHGLTLVSTNVFSAGDGPEGGF